MKNIFTVILLFLCFSVSAQNNILKVYQKNGLTNLFTLSTVDSITDGTLIKIYQQGVAVAEFPYDSIDRVTYGSASDVLIDIDNNAYQTVILGTQTWMGENLRVTRYSNGVSIANETDDFQWTNNDAGAWSYYNNDAANNLTYGKLYNWFAAVSTNNLCPTGWHVPTDADWKKLEAFLGMPLEELNGLYDRGMAQLIGGKMKFTGTVLWESPNDYATNVSSFTGLPGGYRLNEGSFINQGFGAHWWTSSDKRDSEATSFDANSNTPSSAWVRELNTINGSISRNDLTYREGLSVRCVKNAGNLATITTQNITAIAGSNALSGLNITNTGGSSITASGLVWSTSPNPTIALSTKLTTGSESISISSLKLTGLMPLTTYYVRAYAANDAGTAYGNQVSFTTTAPTTATLNSLLLNFSTSSGTFIGNTISDDGGAEITERGIVWGTSPNPTIALATKITETTTGSGYYTSLINNLSASTAYYIRAYATNSVGTAYGNSITVSTGNALPTLTTTIATTITQTGAVSGGNITSAGGTNDIVTASGVVWSTSTNPTIALSTKTTDGNSIGMFTSVLTGLSEGKTYYIRAYATNSAGTAYGNEVSFSTTGSQIVQDIDGNIYQTVVIGRQIWMAENLRTTKYRNGTEIRHIPDSWTWQYDSKGGWGYYSNNASNNVPHGKMYNWYAVNNSNLLCPAGWHIPSDAEWNKLVKYLDANADTTAFGSQGAQSAIAGKNMKSTGTQYWSYNTNATNSSGFSAIPGGIRDWRGNFQQIRDLSIWWSSSIIVGSSYEPELPLVRLLASGRDEVIKLPLNKNTGLSVRCISDATPPPTQAVIITSSASNIYSTSASGGGNIKDDGGAAITARGIVWSTSPNPIITLSTKTANGTGKGYFISELTGLTAGTTYYVRAYATNSAGTAYGNQVMFTATAPPSNTVTDVEGNVYNTVQIGTQTWMAENLRVSKYRNGTDISNVLGNTYWANNTAGAWSYYNNDVANNLIYGKLYNWYAVANTNNLCPTGWHVPTDAEWTTLTTFLGGEAVAGGKMKSTGTQYWQTPNTDATNSSGFAGLPGGYRSFNGSFFNVGLTGYWWSSTESNTNFAWFRDLSYNYGDLTRTNYVKTFGFSVRCLRD